MEAKNEVQFQLYLLRGILEHPSVLSYIEPDLFSSDPVFVEVLNSLRLFTHKYGKTPDLVEFCKFVSEQVNQAYTIRAIEVTESLFSLPPPSDFTLEKLGDHVRFTMTKRLGFQIADFVVQNKDLGVSKDQTKAFVSQVDKLSNVRFVQDEMSKGFFEDFDNYVYSIDVDESKMIPTLIPMLDANLRGGVEAGTLNVVLGGTNAGKSVFLVNFAACAVAAGHRALYVSLEMSKQKISGRLYQRMCGLTYDQMKYEKEYCRWVWGGISWGGLDAENNPVYQIPRRTFFERGKLEVSFFPTATILTLREELRRCEKVFGWRPNLVIVDYGDLLTPINAATKERRHQLEAAFIELRQFACEENVALWSASQLNKMGVTSKAPSITDIAEGWAKVWVMDNALVFSEEKDKKDTIVLKGDKVRDGKKGFLIRLQTNFDKMLIKEHPDQNFSEETEEEKPKRKKKDDDGIVLKRVGERYVADVSNVPLDQRQKALDEYQNFMKTLQSQNNDIRDRVLQQNTQVLQGNNGLPKHGVSDDQEDPPF